MSSSSGVFLIHSYYKWAFNILSIQSREADKRQPKAKQNQHPSKARGVYNLGLMFSPQIFHSSDLLILICTPNTEIRKLFYFSVIFETPQQVYFWNLFLESFICFVYPHFEDFLITSQMNVLSCSQERGNIFFLLQSSTYLKSSFLLCCLATSF